MARRAPRIRRCVVKGTAYKPSLGKTVPVCKRYEPI
jgi:hypothetical protein